MRVANHERHAFEGGNLLRSALRIASGNQDAGRGVGAMNAADRRARILIGRRSYGAGVQHNDFGFRRCAGSRQTAVGQTGVQSPHRRPEWRDNRSFLQRNCPQGVLYGHSGWFQHRLRCCCRETFLFCIFGQPEQRRSTCDQEKTSLNRLPRNLEFANDDATHFAGR